ncbi:AMP-binding protein [Granulosicoccus antarcticus]|uniref:Acetyl-coenzyme A synthetase n=1 Tax=Granulosicoccus antarcticus IMCC3135 TaxID=1192854 RepID=A0A2Z2NWG8_9GAMM|nr:AMP-binding protein [Granulosicoccus antarcticus]ASJ73170.1 Acetyl-coenzyme A synthetase [Granulosicoccus antarcticus IMCC3135]
MTSNYKAVYEQWQQDPSAFWEKAAENIDWIRPATQVFNAESGAYGRWFDGALCNTCANCVDRHVEAGNGERLALIYDSPVTGQVRKYTYQQLLVEVGALASVMLDAGVSRGDRVIIYMPMVAEAIIAMLACARIGAVHSVVFGGFAAPELATRIEDATAKYVISASCGIEPGRLVAYKPLLDEAIKLSSHKPDGCLILQREQLSCELLAGRDADYAELVGAAMASGRVSECVPVAATDPLYILYTSGTTGQPKGVVRDNGGHMVALRWALENHYGMKPGDVFWAASDVGWVVGHSFICYGPLLNGNTTVVYEGKPVGTPDAGAFWRVIQDHKVAALFAAPTALRSIKKVDPQGEFIKQYDLSAFRTLFLAGERSDVATIEWAQEKLQRPVVDHWWQTETGWPMSGNPVGLGLLPVKPGSPGVPMPGYDIQVLDDEGHSLPAGELGNIVCKLPLPPSGFPTLWNAEERFHDAYLSEYPGYYATADAGMIDEEGYVFIMSRTDDIINVAGHRLSTGAMEEVIGGHPDIAESAVVGLADPLKRQLPVGFYVTNDGVDKDPELLQAELVQRVREAIGPVAAFKIAIEVPRLPKTRSGKVLRGTIQKIGDGVDWKLPAAIDDPESLAEITEALVRKGILKRG